MKPQLRMNIAHMGNEIPAFCAHLATSLEGVADVYLAPWRDHVMVIGHEDESELGDQPVAHRLMARLRDLKEAWHRDHDARRHAEAEERAKELEASAPDGEPELPFGPVEEEEEEDDDDEADDEPPTAMPAFVSTELATMAGDVAVRIAVREIVDYLEARAAKLEEEGKGLTWGRADRDALSLLTAAREIRAVYLDDDGPEELVP